MTPSKRIAELIEWGVAAVVAAAAWAAIWNLAIMPLLRWWG